MNRTKAKRIGSQTYDRLTAETAGGAILVAFGMVLLMALFSTFALGIVAGAGDALNGASIADEVNDLRQLERTTWADMEATNPLTRSVYGLFHWLVVLSVEIGLFGLHLGYAIPELGYVLSPTGDIIMVAFLAVGILQGIRLFEIAGKRLV